MKTNEKNEYKVGDFVLPISLKYTNEVCELSEDLGYDFRYKTKSGRWGFIVKSFLPVSWRHATSEEITSGIASQIQMAKSFIVEYGLLKAMEVLKNAPEGSTHHNLVTAENLDLYFNSKDHLEWCELELKWCLPRFHYTNEIIMGMIDIAVLKRIVESVDLVKKCGGIESIKDTFDFAWAHGADELTEYGEQVKQAIADYESIFGGEHV
jgi:hypothetical protein